MPNETKSTSPKWEVLIEAYSNGAGDIEIARLLNITRKKFYQLCDDSPAFAEFVEKGRTLSEAWWYEKGRTALWDKSFNVALYNFNMKNRFGWADKVETNNQNTTNEPSNLDEARSQLREAIARVSKKNPELLSGVHLKVVGGVGSEDYEDNGD